METCKCSKEKTIEQIRKDIQVIQLKDVEKEKDMESFQKSLDKLNETLDELKIMMEDINNKPLEKYERIWNIVTGGVVGAIIAFLMNTILGGK